jgi:hypothetical protein
MSTLLTIGGLLVSASVAFCVGRYVGGKLLSRWMSVEWVLVLGLMFALVIVWLAFGPLRGAREYLIVVAIFLGSVLNGALHQPVA